MIIEILGKGVEERKAKGNNIWFELPLKYRSAKGEASKILRSFDPIYEQFKNFDEGVFVDVKVVKEGSYWNWKGATETNADSFSKTFTPTSERTGGQGKATEKPRKTGDWETAEERSFKQRCIVGQSSVSNSLEYFSVMGVSNVPLTEVLSKADEIYDYVMRKANASPE